ncbi:ATP-dependent RNA helicase HrpA [Arenicella xantha]|uniref:ATP-dependent helicase HrpA n=1 Tax=Arenicella xantha TaxID=644221 RepID=A0A395JQD4_9GAMM|nr:ATP-dependent RNA helicase HrpA [Arenicella xantha]RBP50930.1 ATP-dependent helicase HrpA [Arenicella xantha]
MPKAKPTSKTPLASTIIFPDSLPICQRRDEIAELIKANQVVIVAGETGSGKTTQLPKICLSLGYGEKGLIGHTQPRRIAARTVADRIASELKTALGETVGYQVRFKDLSSANTRIKLMTDGVLLSEFQHDRLLRKYEVIIIDEAHERSLNIDFILGLLKPLASKRPDLKIIITSATIDLEKFAEHFSHNEVPAPIIEVSGRTYPVETIYQPIETENEALPDTITRTVESVLRDEAKGKYRASGDILIFCAGERDIRETAQSLRRAELPIDVLPLYSRLSVAEQNKVFKPAHRRKVVLATNVAETSITVPGIAYVIDPGLARISRYSFRSKIQRLPIEAVSQASANQRMGRCGRVANGVCIRLYSKADFDQRPLFTPAEILRSNLASVILKMLRLKIRNIYDFEFLDKPDRRLLNDGYKLLQELNAIDTSKRLTTIGRQMSDLSIDPKFARILVAANEQGCLTDGLVLLSVLSIQDPRERPAEKQQTADQSHKTLFHPASDLFTYLNLWQAVLNARDSMSNSKFKSHCGAQYWSIARIFEWRELKHQLATQCRRLGWKIDAWQPLTLPAPADKKPKRIDFDKRYETLHRALLSGLLSNIALKDIDGEYLAARSRRISIFPGSSQAKRQPKWLVAGELLETSRVFAHSVGEVKPEWIIQASAHLLSYNHSAPHYHVRSGSVKAYRKTLLYGLVLRDKEPVNYSPINPSESRSVFIQQALVNQLYQPRNKHAEFVEHNRKLIKQIEKIETKTRKRNLLVNDDAIFDFYAQRLPETISNRADLELWLSKGNQDSLKLTREQLLISNVDEQEVAQFPDHIEVHGKRISIEYKFNPGQHSDGVTMVIPISVLAPFPVHVGEWLVPGLLREKCIALIKTLPKSIRRNFAPAADAIDRVLTKLTPGNHALHQQLAEVLYKTRGVKVQGSDFCLEKLDSYYQMNYRVIDVDGSLVNEGRDLLVLKSEYADAVQESVHSNHASERTNLEQHKLRSWDFGDLPRQVQYQHQGLTVQAYPMLCVSSDDTIDLLIHDDMQIAHYHTQRGIIALGKKTLSNTTQKQAYKYLRKELMPRSQKKPTGLNALAAQLNSIGPSSAERDTWVEELIDAGLYAACFLESEELIRTQADFETALARGAKDWVRKSIELEGALSTALQQRDDLFNSLKRIKVVSIPVDSALEDIKAQLYRLFNPTFLRYTNLATLKQYPRYLRAIEARLDKLGQNKPETTALLSLQHKLDARINELCRNDQDLDFAYLTYPRLAEFALLLEEWRVSIFAQHLKTQAPVSEKRLNTFWQQHIQPSH